MHTYSPFWIGYASGWMPLSPLWADRDTLELIEPVELHPAEVLDMAAWLRLPERTRVAITAEYAPNRRSDHSAVRG